MTSDELDRLEGILGISLPAKYRRFVESYPTELIETKLNLGWTLESISDRHFRNDVASIVDLNECVRLSGTPWTENDGPWPDKYFVIGDDQCGNYYAIDLESDGQEVWFYNHELGRFECVHYSLESFVRERVRETLEFNQTYRPKA